MKEREKDRLTKVGGKLRKREREREREWNAKGEGASGEMEEPGVVIEEEKGEEKVVNSL